MPETKTKPKFKLAKLLLFVLSYVLVAAIVWKVAVKIQSSPESQQERAAEEISSLIEDVSKLILLPTNETPQVAVINNAEALKKDQPFFVDAEKDDRLLVYVAAKKAIIYRESSRKIVNVALNVGPIQETPAPAEEVKAETPKATSTRTVETETNEQ